MTWTMGKRVKGVCIALEANPFSIVVLAGGQSSRMGCDKAALPWGNGNILYNLLLRLLTLSDDVVVVSNTTRNIILPVGQVADLLTSKGPLSGIHAGLIHAKYSRVFVTACDVPFLMSEMIPIIVQSVGMHDGAVTVHKGKIEPLLACYRKSCATIIEDLIPKKQYSVLQLLDRINWVPVTCFDELDDYHFMNINTYEDYERAKVILERRKQL